MDLPHCCGNSIVNTILVTKLLFVKFGQRYYVQEYRLMTDKICAKRFVFTVLSLLLSRNECEPK